MNMPHVVSCKDIHCPFRNGACSRTTYQVHDFRALGYDSSRKATVGDALTCDYVLFSSTGSRPEIFIRLLPEGAAFGKDIPKGYRVIEFPEKFLSFHNGIPEAFDALPEDFPEFSPNGAIPGLFGFRWRKITSDLFGARILLRFRLLSVFSGEILSVNCLDRVSHNDGQLVIFFDPDSFHGDTYFVENLGFSLAREAGLGVRSCLICRHASRRDDGIPERPVVCHVADGLTREKYPRVTAAGMCYSYEEDISIENEVLDVFVDVVREIYRNG